MAMTDTARGVVGFAFDSVTPVRAQTQAAMNAQARTEFAHADAELNKSYETLLARISDAEDKDNLKQSQRAWLAFRDLKQRLQLTRHAAGQWLLQSATKP